MIQVGEVTDEAALAALREPWHALILASREATAFQTWEWHHAWWQHLGQASGKLWVLTAHDGGNLVGIMPLVVSSYLGLPLRRVAFMCAPASDYQNLIAAPEHVAACRDAFLAHLLSHAERWDFADFQHLPDGIALLDARTNGAVARRTPYRTCPVTTLDGSWDTFLARLGKSSRYNVRRRRRQLEKKFRLELDTVAGEDIAPTMEEMFTLHNRRWRKRGRGGYFSSLAMQRFHQQAALGFHARGWLRLHRMRLDGKVAAVSYCFRLGDRVVYHNGGFDLALSQHSPGLVLMAHAISDAIAEGARLFDFTRGDETYKYHWAAEDRQSHRVVMAPPSLRGRVAFGLTAAESRLEKLGARAVNLLWGHDSIVNRLRHAQARPSAAG
jgi:CelD/BcsL family acetyltransferase involved in cellulose biosynthesis